MLFDWQFEVLEVEPVAEQKAAVVAHGKPVVVRSDVAASRNLQVEVVLQSDPVEVNVPPAAHGTAGVTEFDAADAADVPAEFVAVTVNV